MRMHASNDTFISTRTVAAGFTSRFRGLNPHRLRPIWRCFSHHCRDTARRPPKAHSRGGRGPGVISPDRHHERPSQCGAPDLGWRGREGGSAPTPARRLFRHISIHKVPYNGPHADKCTQKPIGERAARRSTCKHSFQLGSPGRARSRWSLLAGDGRK